MKPQDKTIIKERTRGDETLYPIQKNIHQHTSIQIFFDKTSLYAYTEKLITKKGEKNFTVGLTLHSKENKIQHMR